MKKSIVLLLVILVFSCDTIKFQEQALYDRYEEPPKEVKGSQVIFSDGAGTMWNSLFDCGNFAISDESAYSGERSIKLDWNKASCEWIGFGNSFNNWQPVDLTKDRFTKALSFFVRTQENTAGAIPIVANLEDYGGGGSYYFIDASKYLKGTVIDTTWKQVIVPLWHFPIIEEEVDIASIKQVKFQLEGAGSFYLDEIQLIDYSKEMYTSMRAEVELMKPKGNLNQVIYNPNNFKEDVWGYKNNSCQQLKQITPNNQTPYINWKHEGKECPWSKWGINWNGWYAVNLRGVHEESSIQFSIKSTGCEFKINLEDFTGHKTEVFHSSSKKLSNNSWTKISIPLKSLNLSSKKFDLDQIKQLSFEGITAGEVSIQEIKITNQ